MKKLLASLVALAIFIAGAPATAQSLVKGVAVGDPISLPDGGHLQFVDLDEIVKILDYEVPKRIGLLCDKRQTCQFVDPSKDTMEFDALRVTIIIVGTVLFLKFVVFAGGGSSSSPVEAVTGGGGGGGGAPGGAPGGI